MLEWNLHSINVHDVNTCSDIPCPVGSSATKIQIQKLVAWQQSIIVELSTSETMHLSLQDCYLNI